MGGRLGHLTLPIFSVLAAIGYVYYTTVFVAVSRWLGLSTAAGVANAAAFTALAAACVATYAAAVRRDPGRVPPDFVPDVEDAKSSVHEIKRKGGDLRYCQKCCHYKPPRAHHCRVCKRCVLKMDHHCIWINNCVGHENYKIFLVFVLYAVVASFYSLILIIGSVVHSVPKDEQSGSYSSRTSIIICGVILCPLALALAVLLGWHVYLILQNKTTIEYHEGVRAMWLAEKGGDLYHHPYDLGVYENLISTCAHL
ncbi:probable protein S-acyltransferase 16 isoform X2 [Phragmites australis]|uniref:probable protein S-acyltransferase 16 isoform X2 n=1 Tax=Phragmites australis TaxID=29695 RepID=UPI002D7A0634|nr:probable protein S-acyltransferase 16 isoform X2 [Phragmites australis]